MVVTLADPPLSWSEDEARLLSTSVTPEVCLLTRAGSEWMNYHGNSARTFVVVVAVDDNDSWDSDFTHSSGPLSLSFRLTALEV